jgi:hypothetical protein
MKEQPKLKVVKKSVKHTFVAEERAAMTEEMLVAMANGENLDAEFSSVKSNYKAKIEEAAARVSSISTSLRNGFEFRDKPCVVIYRPEAKKKDFHLVTCEEPSRFAYDDAVAATEDMTQDDFQLELVQAESVFECREEIQLWQPAGNDQSVLVVGRQNKKWFGALRLRVGTFQLAERLDSEQRACKLRSDAVVLTATRARAWLKSNVRDLADGFNTGIDAALKPQLEREE